MTLWGRYYHFFHLLLGNWGSERFSDLPKVKQEKVAEADGKPRLGDDKVYALYHCAALLSRSPVLKGSSSSSESGSENSFLLLPVPCSWLFPLGLLQCLPTGLSTIRIYFINCLWSISEHSYHPRKKPPTLQLSCLYPPVHAPSSLKQITNLLAISTDFPVLES